MDFIYFLIIFLILFLTFKFILSPRSSRLPPGPWGIPIFGYLPFLGVEPWKEFLRLKKIYGPIIYMRFGSMPAIVLQDEASLKQAFSQLTFCERPDSDFFTQISKGFKGIIFAGVSDALEQRTFLLRNLRDFGYGRKTMEEKIMDQVQEFMSEIQMDSFSDDKMAGEIGEQNLQNIGDKKYAKNASHLQPINMKNRFTSTVASAFTSIFMSRRFHRHEPKFLEFEAAVKTALTSPGYLGEMAIFMPWLCSLLQRLTVLFPMFSGLKERIQGYMDIYQFASEEITNHDLTRVKDQPRDFIDAYLDKVESTSSVESTFHKSRQFDSVAVGDILLAAMDTTSVALEFLILHLVRNPIIQSKIFEEVSRVTGNSRPPGLNDRPSMPLTTAVGYELLRASTFVPFGVLHCTSEEVEFNGYLLPKSTLIYPNIYGIHQDPDTWDEPEQFRPRRFLDAEGKLKKCGDYVPFLIGRRNCPGQTQAMDTIFLFTACLVQKFSIECFNNQVPSLDWVPGTVCTPKEFKVNFVPRD